MAMTANFLALDTSTDTGLVILNFNGKSYARMQQEPREHNRFLLAMIEEVLAEAKIDLNAVDAFVCGHGPGSFVGVRLGVAVIQGLAYAKQKPVYAISSLALQAQAFFRQYPEEKEVIIAHDARMQALYLGRYQNQQGIAKLVGVECLVNLVELAKIDLAKGVPLVGTAAHFFSESIVVIPQLESVDLEQQAQASLQQQKSLSPYELQPAYFNDESNWQKIN